MKKQRTVQTKLQCTDCGTVFPIQRKASKKKELGHIKHMYCPTCKEVKAFEEIKEKDKNISFWEDWQNNF